jgi:hypothetical protein
MRMPISARNINQSQPLQTLSLRFVLSCTCVPTKTILSSRVVPAGCQAVPSRGRHLPRVVCADEQKGQTGCMPASHRHSHRSARTCGCSSGRTRRGQYQSLTNLNLASAVTFFFSSSHIVGRRFGIPLQEYSRGRQARLPCAFALSAKPGEVAARRKWVLRPRAIAECTPYTHTHLGTTHNARLEHD